MRCIDELPDDLTTTPRPALSFFPYFLPPAALAVSVIISCCTCVRTLFSLLTPIHAVASTHTSSIASYSMGLQSSPMLLPAPTATAAGSGSQWRTAVAGNGNSFIFFYT